MARHVAENGTHHGEGWKETSTKAFHLQQRPYWVCLFQSPICFVLRPFQFVYIWPLLERDSLLIYCPPLPESAVKSAQGPPAGFGPCSYIVSPGRWLLFQRQAMQGKALPEHHKDLAGEKKKRRRRRKKKKKPPHESPRNSSTAAQCGCVWIADVVGPLPPTVVFFCLFFFSATFSNKMRHLFNYQQEGVYLKVHYVFFWEVILIRGEKSSLTVFFFFF